MKQRSTRRKESLIGDYDKIGLYLMATLMTSTYQYTAGDVPCGLFYTPTHNGQH